MKGLIHSICFVFIFISIALSASADTGDKFNHGKYKYTVIRCDTEVAITGLTDDKPMISGVVIIPDTVIYNDITYTVSTIDSNVFSQCENITNVVFHDKLQSIGSKAFAFCNGLTRVTLPKSLSGIGTSAFEGCERLKEVEIYSTDLDERFLGKDIFKNCPITSVYYDGVNIPLLLFLNTPTLKELKLGDCVKTIDISAFANCGIEQLTIPCNFVGMHFSSFTGCPIKKITYNCKNVGSWMSLINSEETTVELTDNVEVISEDAFKDCQWLKEIIIPKSVTTIEKGAFSRTNLTQIEIPSSVKIIGSEAFSMAPLRSISLPKSLQTIGDNCFADCPVEELYVNTSLDISKAFNTFDNLEKVYFIDDATTIPRFKGAPKLSFVSLPSPIQSLPQGAFADCVSLKTLDIPTGLKEIGDSCFYNCTSLTNLELNNYLTRIGSYAFAGCSSLSKILLPENIKSIPEGLFKGCNKLEKVYYSDKIKSFGAFAFKDCSNLRSIIIPDGVTEISEQLLSGNSSLCEVLLPNSVISINERAFEECKSLKNIDLGRGIYSIANYAFHNCTSIKSIHTMALNPPYAEMYTFPIESYNKATITVQEQSLFKYNRENPWYRFANYMTEQSAISLSHYDVDMAANESFQLGVYGALNKIEWSSSNPSVAYVNKCGLIVAMGITGSTVITAHVDGEDINCRVIVSSLKRQTPLKSISRAIEEDDNIQQPVDLIVESVEGNPPMVNVRLIPIGSRTVINWSSSDESLANVKNGIVNVCSDGVVKFGATTENGLTEACEAHTVDIEHSNIKDIITNNTSFSNQVYDLTGRCLLRNATKDQIEKLSRGIYIINGKKFIVK